MLQMTQDSQTSLKAKLHTWDKSEPVTAHSCWRSPARVDLSLRHIMIQV